MQIKKTAIAIMMFFVTAFAFADFASAQGYSPLVQIPGVSLISGTTNLSLYLVGMYNFLLSVVGIVAVMMLIIGGMRYITAAGNQAAVSDAKDIIYNALFGLLLAILSWVIVAEINPDVLYIKNPSSEFASSDPVNLGLCGTYNAIAGTCICDDTTPIAGTTDAQDCHDQCMAGGHCNVAGQNICILPGTPVGNTEDSRRELNEIYDGLCQCIDGEEPPFAAGQTCHELCLAAGHCLVANMKIGHYQFFVDPAISIEERTEKYCIHEANKANPLVFTDELDAIVCGEAISGNPISVWEWDWDGDGAWDWPDAAGVFPAHPTFATYAQLLARPDCEPSITPSALLCPIKFRAVDSVGNFYEDVVWARVLAPS